MNSENMLIVDVQYSGMKYCRRPIIVELFKFIVRDVFKNHIFVLAFFFEVSNDSL